MRAFPLLLPVVIAGCGTAPPPKGAAAAPPRVTITQFYAENESVPRGEKVKLCYGVDGAKSVQLNPPVDRVWPSIARCIEVDPLQAAEYTLTATDDQGRSVSQTVRLKSVPPRAKIIEVSVNKTEVKAGEQVTVCYKAQNATSVDAGPGRWITTRANDRGCVADNPRKTTTYHVRLAGAGGSTDAEQVTVRVRP